MLSFFSRATKPATLTFKGRVSSFWNWFQEQAARFHREIQAGNIASLQAEMGERIEELFPGFSWFMGPDQDGKTSALTLTGDGNPHRQLLAVYWQTQAPALPGWTFYSAKQPTRDINKQRIRIRSMEFDPLAFWLVPSVDVVHQKVNLLVWHPSFASLDERLRWTVIFLYLDEVLGEVGTQAWIGEIEPGEHQLRDAIPLKELPTFVADVAEEYGWEKGGPGEVWTSYTVEDPIPGALRRDIVAGCTCQLVLVAESETGHLDPDPLEGTGADYVYVAFPANQFPEGGEAEARERIEEVLDAALGAGAAGRVVGGALGLDHAYIDLLLFDGPKSLEIVRSALRAQGLAAISTVQYFARSRGAAQPMA